MSNEQPSNGSQTPTEKEKPELDVAEVLKRFKALPKRYSGKLVEISFLTTGGFSPVAIDVCEALRLTVGDALFASIEVSPEDPEVGVYEIYAQGRIADSLLALSEGQQVKARVRTAFGIVSEVDSTDAEGSFIRKVIHTGLVVTKLVEVNSIPVQDTTPSLKTVDSVAPRLS